MSNSFAQLWLASLAGIATYYLIENVYYEVAARIKGRKYQKFMDDLEEETWEYFED
jgi:uncharacterized membrane protein YdjX (TVP38/TMEM64 family)